MKQHTYTLRLYPNTIDERFEKTPEGVFLSEGAYNSLVNEVGYKNYEAAYAHIRCNDPLNKFSFYSQVDKLAKSSVADNELLFVHKNLVGNILDTGKLQVELEPINLEEVPVAKTVIIQLPENDVVLWAEDEIAHAQNAFAAKNAFLSIQKEVWISPKTKPKVKGRLVSINGEAKPDGIYRLAGETNVQFLGLPTKRQKTLEFNTVGGLGQTINRLREIIQLPLNYPEFFEKFRVKSYRGILLHGPPGNGKTMIARSLAGSLGAKFFPVEGPELMSKNVSVGERELRKKFEDAEEAGKSIIFIDELDSIAVNRNDDSQDYEIRFVSTLLNLMDGMRSNSGVVIMGATNRLHAIDPAFRRPGRFDVDFEIPMPDTDARFDIFKIYADIKSGCFDNDVDDAYIKELCNKAPGFSGADLAGVYRESVMNAMRRHLVIDALGKTDITVPIESITITRDDLQEAFNNFICHDKRIVP